MSSTRESRERVVASPSSNGAWIVTEVSELWTTTASVINPPTGAIQYIAFLPLFYRRHFNSIAPLTTAFLYKSASVFVPGPIVLERFRNQEAYGMLDRRTAFPGKGMKISKGETGDGARSESRRKATIIPGRPNTKGATDNNDINILRDTRCSHAARTPAATPTNPRTRRHQSLSRM